MSLKQNDHYRETLIEAAMEDSESFEEFCKAIDNLIELELQRESWWTQLDQDEEYQQNDLEMYPNK